MKTNRYSLFQAYIVGAVVGSNNALVPRRDTPFGSASVDPSRLELIRAANLAGNACTVEGLNRTLAESNLLAQTTAPRQSTEKLEAVRRRFCGRNC